MKKFQLKTALTAVAFSMTASLAVAAELSPAEQAAKTEVWEPVPAMVTAKPNQAPSDAIVLFSKDNLDAWHGTDGGKAQWDVNGDTFTVKPGTGMITTNESFCDAQVHLEWKSPTDVEGLEGQERNNSGVFLQSRYEVQILDSYNNKTYPNGQAGSIYKQAIPLVNPINPPGEWQTYDIIYDAPEFDGEKLVKPAYVTVLINGVLVQNHTEILGGSEWIGAPSYKAHGCAPLQLQDHSNPITFRNVWVRKISDNHITDFR